MSDAAEFAIRAAAFWRERGGRMTPVREMLCRAIEHSEGAFVADELLERARKLDRGISSASVYRALSDLVEAGLLREIRGPRDQRSFVRAGTPQAKVGHVVCTDCHRVIPLEDECVPLREAAMLKRMGFAAGGMHLRIEAACESMKRCGTCEKRCPSPDSE
ncbi:transcriptional repressor [Luteolibacter sp. LG18]|uniref:Fur family transcriptional regulator n=1 Tax=Luteolibacter sp. LG18 TaxID=2819286 RepID=UPI0030C761B2